MATTANEFYQLSGFPMVLCVVVDTRISIQHPPGDEERAFVNRRHNHCINVQAIAGSEDIFYMYEDRCVPLLNVV